MHISFVSLNTCIPCMSSLLSRFQTLYCAWLHLFWLGFMLQILALSRLENVRNEVCCLIFLLSELILPSRFQFRTRYCFFDRLKKLLTLNLIYSLNLTVLLTTTNHLFSQEWSWNQFSLKYQRQRELRKSLSASYDFHVSFTKPSLSEMYLTEESFKIELENNGLNVVFEKLQFFFSSHRDHLCAFSIQTYFSFV